MGNMELICMQCRGIMRHLTASGKSHGFSPVDFRYTELLCIPAVTSMSLKTCDSVLGDTLEFHQVNQGSLRV